MVLPTTPSIGVVNNIDLGAPEARQTALSQIAAFAERELLSTGQKNDLAAELACKLGVDYQELLRLRILQLLIPEEIAELAAHGIRFELHTHRHRTPLDRALFEKEILDNRAALESIPGVRPVHFCYPSGHYDRMFLPWLTEMGVVSATTCDPGLASRRDEPLLLPRFIDASGRTGLEFESWLTGVGAMLWASAGASRLRNLVRS
jgi:hypothetical protein